MSTQFLYAVAIGAAIGIALCAMRDNPVATWVNAWGKYRWGRFYIGAAAGSFAATGSVVIGGAILGLGLVLSVNGDRPNRKDKD